MEAVAAVMQASILLVVFGVLACVFTRLRAAPPVTGCGLLGWNWSGGPSSRLPSRVSGGLVVASGALAGRRAAGLVLLALAAALFHVMARAGPARLSTVVLGWGRWSSVSMPPLNRAAAGGLLETSFFCVFVAGIERALRCLAGAGPRVGCAASASQPAASGSSLFSACMVIDRWAVLYCRHCACPL